MDINTIYRADSFKYVWYKTNTTQHILFNFDIFMMWGKIIVEKTATHKQLQPGKNIRINGGST